MQVDMEAMLEIRDCVCFWFWYMRAEVNGEVEWIENEKFILISILCDGQLLLFHQDLIGLRA